MQAWLLRSRCLAVLAVAASLALVVPVDAQRPLKRVLSIHGGTESFPGNVRFDATLRQTLLSDPTIEVDSYAEFLETEEFGVTAETSLRDYIRAKFRDRRLDAVIVNTAPAVAFALRYRADLFPNLPIVFVATSPPAALLRGEVPGVTGVVREPSQTETVELALKLQPRTTRIHVVAYAPLVEGYQQRIASALAPVARGVTVTYANEATLADALGTIRRLPADSLIFYTRYSPIATSRVLLADEVIAQIAEASPVPVYSSNDNDLGKGVVGGMMRSEIAIAARLGEITLQILKGAKPEDIPIESARLAPMFDWRQVQRWGLNPALLPPGSEIRFRVPTVWELYGSYITGTLVVVGAQLLLITGLLQSRARLRRADNTIRASEASLRVSYDRIRQLAGRLINAQEAARAEIARDLHDDVCQRLTSVSIGVGTLKNATGSLEDPKMQEGISELDRETRDAFESLRRLSHDLHPVPLRLLGLAPALRSHCHEVAKRHGGQVQFSSADSIGAVHPDVAVCFFRIAQEALRNSVVHGGAKQMIVTLGREGEELDLTVVDDGQGFDVAAARSNGRGLGLVTMEERINLVGGHMSIVSVPGQGTTVRVRGPVNPHPLTQAGIDVA
jgi:signal transduction histidine kinase